jgi:hypothetical protein
MNVKQVDGVWVAVCDWVDPKTGKPCDLGYEGAPRMSVDPDGGQNPDTHFQCGSHHGVVKQEHRPEFQLPDEQELNEEILKQGQKGDTITIEEVEDDRGN